MSIPASSITTATLEGSFWRYRVMAWVVGVMLLLLCVVAIPLQFAANKPAVANVGFTIHGVLYLVYLLAAGDFALRAKLGLRQIIGLVCAGFVPGLAFYIEHRTATRVLAAYDPDGGTAEPSGAPADKRSAR